MTFNEIVKSFTDLHGKSAVRATKEFELKGDKESVAMLGTYSPVQSLSWAVVAQKPQRQAYEGVFEMQRTANWLALSLVLTSKPLTANAAPNPI